MRAESAPALTIQEAVKQALSRNPDVLKARETVQQSDGAYSMAISRLLPTVSAHLEASTLKQPPVSPNVIFGGQSYNQYQVLLNATQPLWDGGAMLAGFRYSRKERELKQYQVEIAERTLTQAVIEAFYSVLLAERQLQILKETYSLNQTTLGTAERYFRIGRGQRIDVLQMRAQVALLPPKIIATQNQLQTATARLATLLRLVNESEIRLTGKLASPGTDWIKATVPPKPAELPEMKYARLLVEQFQDNRSVQMAPNWPQLGLFGMVGRTTYSKTDLLDQANTNWGVGIQLNIPLFSGLSLWGQRKALASQERQLEHDETKAADTVSINQVQTVKDLDTARSQLDSSREAAELGRESLKEAERSYRLQTISYLQYQNSLQTYLDSENGFYLARYNYIVTLGRYFNAIGVPLSILVSELVRLESTPGVE